MKAFEYILVVILMCVMAYCVVTPLASQTASSLNESAALIEEASQFE